MRVACIGSVVGENLRACGAEAAAAVRARGRGSARGGWGGRRVGAGRRRIALRALVPHRTRPRRLAWQPLHVTTRLVAGLPDLREPRAQRVLLCKLREGSCRFGFRLIEYSVQSTHFHLLVEVADRRALTRGAKGLFVRLARALNKLWRRKGRVFAHRYHALAKATPRAVRNALVYVLHNARKHGALGLELDPFSSAPWFDGYLPRPGVLAVSARRAPRAAGPPIARGRTPAVIAVDALLGWPRVTQRAATWLLARGWRRLGLIDVCESPATRDDSWPVNAWRFAGRSSASNIRRLGTARTRHATVRA